MKHIHDEQLADFPFKSISDQFSPNENYSKVEFKIILPFEMCIEQLEISLLNNALFTKYFKFFRIETNNCDKNIMHLKGGFHDLSKK